MKKLFYLLLAMIAVIFISCQQKVDFEKEKAAIIDVLNTEGSAFIEYDLEKVFSLHMQDELATRFDGNKIYKDWDEIRSLYESYAERNKQETTFANPKNIKENIICKVTGKTAWLICDNIWKYDLNNVPQESKNIKIAFMEKINNDWKFSFNAFIPLPGE